MTAVRLPPGPTSRIPASALLAFRRDPLGFLSRVGRDYGDLASWRAASIQFFFLNHPDLVKEVLVTRQAKFVKSRALQRARSFLGDGLLTVEGEQHRRERRLAQPAFHRERVASYAEAMVDLAERARDRWRDGERIDAAHEMMRLTLGVVGRTLFGADVEGEAEDIGRAVTAILGHFDRLVMPFSELLDRLPLPSNRRFERAAARLDETVYRMIAERRASPGDRGDLLSMLLAARDEEGDGTGMSDKQLRDECLTIFLAGHETTANSLTWTWYLLSHHPEVEARLHEEIDGVLGGRRPSFADLPRLSYAEAVLAEAMRLYPPAWAVGRQSTEDVPVGEYVVPANSIVLMSQYVMHRDPRFWPDPERFDPDRWTPEARATRPKFAYFPFGGGARGCIGESFAWMEGVLLLATLARRWRLELAPDARVEPQAVITLRPRYGMPMIAHER
jgi:cytochrome P450